MSRRCDVLGVSCRRHRNVASGVQCDYEVDSRGRIKLESKYDMAKRGVKSLDRADALMLAYANRTPGMIEYYRDRAEALAKVGGNPALLPQ